MFQTIDHRTYYVVDLKEVPGPASFGPPVHDGGDPALTPYAEALSKAIDMGLVDSPGKYAIAVNHTLHRWDIFKIIEPVPALQ